MRGAGPNAIVATMRAWCVLAAVLSSADAFATLLIDLSLDDLVDRSERVVVGRIASKTTIIVGGRPMTETRVLVEETLSGPREPEIMVTQIGGVSGGIESEVVGDARLALGARMLLFTFVHADGRRYLIGMSQGAFVVEGDRASQRIDVPVVRAGRVHPGGPRSRSLAEVRAAIARRR